MTQAKVGTTDITGPSRYIHNALEPIVISPLKFGEINHLNVLTTVVSEDKVSDVLTESESVTITTVQLFKGSFRRAKNKGR